MALIKAEQWVKKMGFGSTVDRLIVFDSKKSERSKTCPETVNSFFKKDFESCERLLSKYVPFATDTINLLLKHFSYEKTINLKHLSKSQRGTFRKKDALWERMIRFVFISSLYDKYSQNVKRKRANSLLKIEGIVKEIMDSAGGKPLYFRGDTGVHYGLIPSAFRNLDPGKTIDRNRITQNYEGSGARARFENVFGKTYDIHFEEYMQHCLGYSPLLDLTKSWKIALSFSFSNIGQLQDFSNRQAKMTAFIGLNENAGKLNDFVVPEDTRVEKIEILDIGRLLEKHGIQSTRDFLEYLKPEYELFTEPNNDRMKYQQGSLLLVKKAIILGDCLPWFLLDEIRIIEIVVPAGTKNIGRTKNKILKAILKDCPFYSQANLMDPYKYIGGK